MPLKHRTETAFIVLLGVVIALTGTLVSLLPLLPYGLMPSLLLLLLTIAYPLTLFRLLKRNRADYEFRFLHWYPALMVVLWIVFALLSARFHKLILVLAAASYLWALPLVIIGIGLLILFCIHVVRRSAVRIALLSGILFLFMVGSIVSRVEGYNSALSARVYPPSTLIRLSMAPVPSMFIRIITDNGYTVSDRGSGSIISFASSARSSFNMSPPDGGALIAQVKEREQQQRLKQSIKRLPRSGPEDFVVLALSLLALYSGALHWRAKERMD